MSPYKHQSDSYRNRGGVRYVGYNDCMGGVGETPKQEAQRLVKELRAAGSRAFYENHDDYYRVFAEVVQQKGDTE